MKTVLLADEDESVRRMIARVLETAGYIPLLAASAQKAVLALEAERPDLVLLDLTSSGDEGWRAFEQITHLDPSVPVIVIAPGPNEADHPLRPGTSSLMEKPLDLPRLLNTIETLLESSEKEARRTPGERSSINQVPA